MDGSAFTHYIYHVFIRSIFTALYHLSCDLVAAHQPPFSSFNATYFAAFLCTLFHIIDSQADIDQNDVMSFRVNLLLTLS